MRNECIVTEVNECPCWCHKDPQPEYDSYRDYFECHSGSCVDCLPYCGNPDCPNCKPRLGRKQDDSLGRCHECGGELDNPKVHGVCQACQENEWRDVLFEKADGDGGERQTMIDAAEAKYGIRD